MNMFYSQELGHLIGIFNQQTAIFRFQYFSWIINKRKFLYLDI